nr:MAG TPA: hypothetical protein [Bacteriophage sp.]
MSRYVKNSINDLIFISTFNHFPRVVFSNPA